MEVWVLIALAGIAVLSSLGVLLSKDNFYSSLYMSATLIFVASIYAIFNLQPVFVLIVFVFVGAIGIVTVAIRTHKFYGTIRIPNTCFIAGGACCASTVIGIKNGCRGDGGLNVSD
jgi:NADH-quinone oxidoreductase subunit J